MNKLHKTLLLAFLASIFSLQSFSQITIIQAGNLLAVPGEGMQQKKTIVIENGRILKVEDGYLNARQLGYDSDETEIIDLRDQYVLPGLIDLHTHVTHERDPEADPHEWTTLYDEEMALRAIPYLQRTLEAGFTTVRDLGAEKASLIISLKHGVQQGLIAGPRIIAANSMLSASGGHGDFHGYRPEITEAFRHEAATCDGSDDCRRAVRELVMSGADVIKIAATGGVLSNTAAGVGQQLTDDELKAIVETAHALGRPVTAHAHAAEGVKAALRAGVNSIEHGSYLDEEAVALFKEKDAWLIPTLLAGVSVVEEMEVNDNIPPAIKEKARQVAPVVEASFKLALKSGVKIAFGTDSGVSRHGDNAREFVIMVKYGMEPEAAIRSATVSAAEVLGMTNQLGTIEAGKYADLIAVSANPIQDIETLRDVKFVMQGGKLIKK